MLISLLCFNGFPVLAGGEAAYSTLLQFLLDHGEKGPDKNNEDINSELTEDQFAEDILKKVVPALLSKSPASSSGLKKKGIKSHWVSIQLCAIAFPCDCLT